MSPEQQAAVARLEDGSRLLRRSLPSTALGAVYSGSGTHASADLRLILDAFSAAETRARDAEGVARRLRFRLDDLLELNRQLEPDYASAEDRHLTYYAREASGDAKTFLERGVYRQAGPVETRMDQARLAPPTEASGSAPDA